MAVRKVAGIPPLLGGKICQGEIDRIRIGRTRGRKAGVEFRFVVRANTIDSSRLRGSSRSDTLTPRRAVTRFQRGANRLIRPRSVAEQLNPPMKNTLLFTLILAGLALGGCAGTTRSSNTDSTSTTTTATTPVAVDQSSSTQSQSSTQSSDYSSPSSSTSSSSSSTAPSSTDPT